MLVKTENLSKIYYTREIETIALQDINFEIADGEYISVMGPSGCGKTTLLNIMGMLDSPSGGSYFFDDKRVEKMNERQRSEFRKSNLGFVFQSFNLIDDLTVFENIELPLTYLKYSSKDRIARVEEVLEKMQLSHRKNFFPQQLSGGQQQRVAISRAIVAKPRIILADEPTGNLDSVHGKEVMQLLTRLNEEGTTIIIVTHSKQVAEYSHRILNLFDGKVIAEIIN